MAAPSDSRVEYALFSIFIHLVVLHTPIIGLCGLNLERKPINGVVSWATVLHEDLIIFPSWLPPEVTSSSTHPPWLELSWAPQDYGLTLLQPSESLPPPCWLLFPPRAPIPGASAPEDGLRSPSSLAPSGFVC